MNLATPFQTRLLNNNWLFWLGDDREAGYMGYDDRAWRSVTLPHDWAVEFPFDRQYASGTGYLPGGTAWYRKRFTLTETEAEKRIVLHFDGVYKHAQVWVNSNYLGPHAYGYTPFFFDISPYIRPGENVIAVRVEHNDVADSRWYTGSGIYRSVFLTLRDPAGFCENGVFVTTVAVRENGSALLRVRYETNSADGVRLRLLDGKDEAAAAQFEGSAGTFTFEVPQAKLWSTETPFLYQLRLDALQSGGVIDTQQIAFGIRTCRFDPDAGFFLNGEHLLLKGVCLHHDAGALGAAVPENVWLRRLETLKGAGCNAIRTAHNPPAAPLLDLCDRLGLLVMDEAFDEWEGCKNKWWQGHNVWPPKHFGYAEDFPLWHARDLRAMVERDRNHPSVILWSVGNEIDYPNDPYVTPLFDEVLGNNDTGKPERARRYDDKKPDARRLATVAKELVAAVHDTDDSRPVLSALSFPELSTRTGFSDALDLLGYNYRETHYDEDHGRFPQTPILGSENGHAPSAWQAVLDRPFIAGQFLWTGIDFLGECRGWPLRISQAGLLDLCGFPKPLYYQRKALWTQQPFVRIAVCKGTKEQSIPWTDTFLYDAQAGETVCVCVYTNAAKATLLLNGKSLGEQTRTPEDECRLLWEFPFAPGTLTAVAEGASDTLSSPGSPAAIQLEPYASPLQRDESIVQVAVSLRDKAGALCAGADCMIHYQLRGDAELLGIENGRPDDLTPYGETRRAAFCGRAIVYLRKNSVAPAPELYAYTKDGLHALLRL